MNTIWVLVCNASRGRIFEILEPAADWKQIDVFAHGESRQHVEEIVSDRAGSKSSLGGSSHHGALAPSTDPKDVEKAHFSHSLARSLDHAMRDNRFKAWVLVAPPQFLGLLRAELTPELKKHLITSVDKDLTHLTLGELSERLRDEALLPPDQRTVLAQATVHLH